ncbi:substrate-binding periplasmic protein [Desulfocurvus sp. DL9XJH121]
MLAALALGAPPPSAAAEAQRVYTVSYDPGARIHVLVRDRLMAVYGRVGLNVSFLPMPHKRSLHCANAGQVDGEAGRVSNICKAYPDLRRVDVPVARMVGVAYVLRGSGIGGYADHLLDSARVGCVQGVLWTEKLLAGRPATLVKDYEGLFDLLLRGRVDMVLGSRYSSRSVLSRLEQGAGDVRELRPVINDTYLYHYVHKKNAALIPLLERTLRQLWREGRWDDQDAKVPVDSLQP